MGGAAIIAVHGEVIIVSQKLREIIFGQGREGLDDPLGAACATPVEVIIANMTVADGAVELFGDRRGLIGVLCEDFRSRGHAFQTRRHQGQGGLVGTGQQLDDISAGMNELITGKLTGKARGRGDLLTAVQISCEDIGEHLTLAGFDDSLMESTVEKRTVDGEVRLGTKFEESLGSLLVETPGDAIGVGIDEHIAHAAPLDNRLEAVVRGHGQPQ